MGYYSDTTIVTTKEAYEDFMIEYAKALPDYPLHVEVTELKDSSYVRLDWCGVKWYTEFTDISFIEKYFLVFSSNGGYYEFLRIGEEYDDVEYFASVPDNEEYRLYCRRTAEVY